MAKTMLAQVKILPLERELPVHPTNVRDGMLDFLPELHRGRLVETLGGMRTEKTSNTADAKQKRK